MAKTEMGIIYQLRSGGPAMTVIALPRSEFSERVCCGWFNAAGNYASEWFDLKALTQTGK